MQRQLTHPGPTTAKRERLPGGHAVEDSAPAWRADGSTVLFVRFRWKETTGSMFSVRRDGSGLRRLTVAAPGTGTGGYGSCDDDPATSPRGRTIVFARSSDCIHGDDSWLGAVTLRGKPTRLPVRMPLEYDRGTEATRLAFEPSWSPNGRLLAYSIAFVSGVDRGDIRLVRADGTGGRRLTRSAADEDYPAWLPPRQR